MVLRVSACRFLIFMFFSVKSIEYTFSQKENTQPTSCLYSPAAALCTVNVYLVKNWYCFPFETFKKHERFFP